MPQSKASRVGDAIFGAFFLALAVAIFVLAWDTSPVGAIVASLVLGFLGAEGIFSAIPWQAIARVPHWSSALESVAPNPSIERTPSGRLRLPTVTAHVER